MYGGEIVGTAKFPADAKLTKLLRVRTLTAPVQCAVEPFVETRFTDKLMSCSQDLLICEFANGDSNEVEIVCIFAIQYIFDYSFNYIGRQFILSASYTRVDIRC